MWLHTFSPKLKSLSTSHLFLELCIGFPLKLDCTTTTKFIVLVYKALNDLVVYKQHDKKIQTSKSCQVF